MKIVPEEVVVDIFCHICTSEEKDGIPFTTSSLNNCGNKKCTYLMCDECILKLKNLSNKESSKCPHCRQKFSEVVIKKEVKEKPESYSLKKNKFCKVLISLKKKITFNKLFWSCIILSFLFYLGNKLVEFLNLPFKESFSNFEIWLIRGFLGTFIIITIWIILAFIIINCFRCFRDNY